MSISNVPAPDADGYWHYTYVTYRPNTGEWYGGKHSTSNLNDGYLGSGKWVRNHPDRRELVIEIIEFFYSEEHAYAAEMALVNFDIIDADPFCRNAMDGGLGFTHETVARRAADPVWQQNVREALARTKADPEHRRRAIAKRSINPEWKKNHTAAMAKRTADPEWQRKNRAATAARSDNPEWLKNLLAAQAERNETMAALRANPEYQRKHREGIARREVNRRAKKAAQGASL